MINLNLQLTDSLEKIENNMVDVIKNILNETFRKSAGYILPQVKDLIKMAIKATPEYHELTVGDLKGQFGIIDSTIRLEALTELWADSTFIDVGPIRRSGRGLTGRIRLTAINADFEDAYQSTLGEYTTEKGVRIPWLEWMTKMGDSIIVRDFVIRSNPPFSRTSTYIMKHVSGAAWQVPSQYSGTFENNFVTRATDSILDDVAKIMEEEILKHL